MTWGKHVNYLKLTPFQLIQCYSLNFSFKTCVETLSQCDGINRTPKRWLDHKCSALINGLIQLLQEWVHYLKRSNYYIITGLSVLENSSICLWALECYQLLLPCCFSYWPFKLIPVINCVIFTSIFFFFASIPAWIFA